MFYDSSWNWKLLKLYKPDRYKHPLTIDNTIIGIIKDFKMHCRSRFTYTSVPQLKSKLCICLSHSLGTYYHHDVKTRLNSSTCTECLITFFSGSLTLMCTPRHNLVQVSMNIQSINMIYFTNAKNCLIFTSNIHN